MPLSRIVGALAAALLLPAVQPAAPAHAEPLVAYYEGSWAGLPAARIRFRFDEAAAGYRGEIAIETEGLARWFTRFRASAESEGRLARDGAAEPERYEARYNIRKWHDRRVEMRFVPSGGAVLAERGTGDTSHKPELAAGFRRNVLDPISAVAAIREALRRAPPKPGRAFTVPVYDGARRFDVAVRIVPDEDKDGLIHLKLVLRPIAGFKGESSDEGDPDDSPRPADATFSNDGKLILVSLSVPVVFIPFVVRFAHFCASLASCGETRH